MPCRLHLGNQLVTLLVYIRTFPLGSGTVFFRCLSFRFSLFACVLIRLSLLLSFVPSLFRVVPLLFRCHSSCFGSVKSISILLPVSFGLLALFLGSLPLCFRLCATIFRLDTLNFRTKPYYLISVTLALGSLSCIFRTIPLLFSIYSLYFGTRTIVFSGKSIQFPLFAFSLISLSLLFILHSLTLGSVEPISVTLPFRFSLGSFRFSRSPQLFGFRHFIQRPLDILFQKTYLVKGCVILIYRAFVAVCLCQLVGIYQRHRDIGFYYRTVKACVVLHQHYHTLGNRHVQPFAVCIVMVGRIYFYFRSQFPRGQSMAVHKATYLVAVHRASLAHACRAPNRVSARHHDKVYPEIFIAQLIRLISSQQLNH